jgi:hypothetical protein
MGLAGTTDLGTRSTLKRVGFRRSVGRQKSQANVMPAEPHLGDAIAEIRAGDLPLPILASSSEAELAGTFARLRQRTARAIKSPCILRPI